MTAQRHLDVRTLNSAGSGPRGGRGRAGPGGAQRSELRTLLIVSDAALAASSGFWPVSTAVM